MSTVANNENPPAKPEVPKITVKVDGKQVEVPRMMPHPTTKQLVPTTMIQACEAAQVTIPHYCYHSHLPVAGNCRMCLVEYGMPVLGPDRKPLLNPDGSVMVKKVPNPAISCATPITAGMEIYTNTASVQAMRKSVLEFLLVNHPLDCPICDQAGECKLQEYSVEYGQTQSRFAEEKVHKPKQVELGPRIMLDDERCILCTRCIRFTRDIVKDDVLGIVNRGSHNTLTHYPGKPFDNNYTLNTVDLCPVGALTSKDFRFQMRVWFLKETPSICTSCATGCNITISSRENRIYRYVPRQNDAVNACWMCDPGRLNYRWIGSEHRLKIPKKRIARDKFENISWQNAVSETADLIRNASPGSVAIIASGRQTNEELFLLSKIAEAKKAVTDVPPRLGEFDPLLISADKNPNMMGAKQIGLTGDAPGSKISEISAKIQNGEIKVVIVFGENPIKLFGKSIAQQIESLVLSDILPNSGTDMAHYVLCGCAHAEKRGSFTNKNGRIQCFHKAVEPPGMARPEREFLMEWVQQIAGISFPINFEAFFNAMTTEVPAFAKLNLAQIGLEGANITL